MAKNVFLKIFEIVLIIYLLICFVAVGMWTYLKFFAPDSYKETTIYANEVSDINGKKSILEFSSYNNLTELKFNYYSDYKSTDVIASGVQIVGNFDDLKRETIMSGFWNYTSYYTYILGQAGKENVRNNRIFFYEESDNMSYVGINNKLNEFGSFRIEIDGISYALQLGKVCYVKNGKLWSSNSLRSSLSLLISDLYRCFKSGTQNVGTSYQTFKFEDYFDIYKFDGNKYELISDTDVVTTYLYTKVINYNSNALTSKDSTFGQVAYNTNWVYSSDNSLLDEHFSDKAIYNLTEQYCVFTYNEEINKHQFDISETFYDTYRNSNLNLKLVLDLDYLNSINVVFGGIKENSLLKQMGVKSYYTQQNGILTEVTI